MKFSDLTEKQVQEICEAFAKREGWIRCSLDDWYYSSSGARAKYDKHFAYTTDLNAMHRIIVGMDEFEIISYSGHLAKNMCVNSFDDMQRATCEQQFVAAALALGLVKEGVK